MVLLLEHEGKDLFKKYGIPTPLGYVVSKKSEIKATKFPAVLKAQVPLGGRGKKGGIIIAADKNQADTAFDKIMSIDFGAGVHAKKVLVEEKIDSEKELYLSVAIDRSLGLPVIIASPSGGIDIESVQEDKIVKCPINPFFGVRDYEKRKLTSFLQISTSSYVDFSGIVDALFRIYKEGDAELAEINPLSIVKDKFIALDSKVVIEDDAMFRHNYKSESLEYSDPLEREAKEKRLSFVRLGGDIGLIANGAGLTMATLDIIKANGGSPGDFLDLGGTDDPNTVVEAFNLVEKTNPKALLINIFGGVTKCDSVALGLLEAIDKTKPAFPITVRLRGFNEKEAVELLSKRGITALSGLEDAIKQTILSSKGKAK